jgi:hypothetical protein
MGDMECLNNKLSPLLPEISNYSQWWSSIFLRDCKFWGSPFKWIVFFEDFNAHQSCNFLAFLRLLFHWSTNSVYTRMNWFVVRIHQFNTNWHCVIHEFFQWLLKLMLFLYMLTLTCPENSFILIIKTFGGQRIPNSDCLGCLCSQLSTIMDFIDDRLLYICPLLK